MDQLQHWHFNAFSFIYNVHDIQSTQGEVVDNCNITTVLNMYIIIYAHCLRDITVEQDNISIVGDYIYIYIYKEHYEEIIYNIIFLLILI